MKTVTLEIDDSVKEQFFWLLEHFSSNEIKILEQSESISDDEYLRSISGMVESIQTARKEPNDKGVGIDELAW
ncbi:hypothetical protein [Candidatus Venteria ishoeyi]|uniref:Uncharacterized protein n=1 Tax=Candidatus Venteria ishoeyi TaxID=1899563 RepID=A0A1H6FG33_9GAMM|nr:hypothetical protein [Candidatus Venteria ishoeyi]SEH08126.1 Uncharacterised protein [Candidatus Venteria ishoeyi]